MADSTINTLPSPTESLDTSDKFIYWDSSVAISNTKSVTLAKLKTSIEQLENFPAANGFETVAGSAVGVALSTSKRVAYLTTTTGNAKFTLGAPVNGYGDYKEIVLTSRGDPALVTLGAALTKSVGQAGTLTFNEIGSSVTLKSHNGKWVIVGFYNVTVA
jgi:hypothetical protein